ncbi:MAG: PilN domain-containing protein [Methanoregulaceae archaeon]|nr:PilN domain-containing protein [Methanoregulaceae archaeon]
MSRNDHPPIPVVEWSPTGVVLFDPASQKLIQADSLAGLRSKIEGDEIVVALSRRSSFVRTTRLPDASKSEVQKILNLQVGTLFPVNPAETAVDFFLTDNRNGEGRLAVVAAVKSDTLKTVLAELQASGLKSRAIVPAALGSALLAGSLGFRDAAVLHETPEGLAIDLVEEGELKAARVVPMPGGSQMPAEVARSFASAKMNPAPVIGAGGFVAAKADADDPRSPLAALSGASLAINLEPPDVVARRAYSKSKRFQRVAIWLWVATIMLAAVIFDERLTKQADVKSGEAKWTKILTAKRQTQSQAQSRLTDIQKVATVLDLGFEPRQRLVDVAAIVTKLTPEGLWVTGMTLERGKPATIRGTSLTGESVTNYLEQLSANPRFRDVKLIFANNGQIEKTSVVQFSMTLHIVGNFSLDSEDFKP